MFHAVWILRTNMHQPPRREVALHGDLYNDNLLEPHDPPPSRPFHFRIDYYNSPFYGRPHGLLTACSDFGVITESRSNETSLRV